VQNDFERGAVVLVVDEQGHALAQGLVNYGSFELDRVRGHRSSQIVDVLGYTYGDEAIHRDNLVFM
jgi:glutamate 5-kinase